MDPDGRASGKELEEVEGREKIIRISSVGKIYFGKKKNKKYTVNCGILDFLKCTHVLSSITPVTDVGI